MNCLPEKIQIHSLGIYCAFPHINKYGNLEGYYIHQVRKAANKTKTEVQYVMLDDERFELLTYSTNDKSEFWKVLREIRERELDNEKVD